MMWPCPTPRFSFDARRGWWNACGHCGRWAWEHEQAEPAEDLRRAMLAVLSGIPDTQPPAMRPGGSP